MQPHNDLNILDGSKHLGIADAFRHSRFRSNDKIASTAVGAQIDAR